MAYIEWFYMIIQKYKQFLIMKTVTQSQKSPKT